MQTKKIVAKILVIMLVFSTLTLTGCTKEKDAVGDNVNQGTNSQKDSDQTGDTSESTAESTTESTTENTTDAEKENVVSDATGKLVITVNDAKINLDELMYYVYAIEEEGNYYDQMYQTYYGTGYWDTLAEEGLTMRDMAKNYVIDTAVMYEILYNKAVAEGYTLTDEETTNCTSNSEQMFEALTVDQLKVTGLMKDVLVKLYEKITLAQKYYTFVVEGLNIDDQAITDGVKKEDYKQYDTKCLYAATVSYDASNNAVEMTAEEKQKVKESMEKALEMVNAGDVFDTVVVADPTIVTNELSFVKGDQTTSTEYEEAASALAVGSNSSIVETTDGYYIIQLVDDSSTESYDTAVSEAIATAQSEGFNAEYELMKADYKVTINDEVWDTIVMGETTIIAAE